MPYRVTGQSPGFGQVAERSRGKVKARASIVFFVGKTWVRINSLGLASSSNSHGLWAFVVVPTYLVPGPRMT